MADLEPGYLDLEDLFLQDMDYLMLYNIEFAQREDVLTALESELLAVSLGFAGLSHSVSPRRFLVRLPSAFSPRSTGSNRNHHSAASTSSPMIDSSSRSLAFSPTTWLARRRRPFKVSHIR
jgi:hypothetical protein